MTYEEIVKLWQESKYRWHEYQFAVGAIGSQIHSYLLKRLSIKDEKNEQYFLKMVPPNEKDDNKLRNTMYAPIACVELKDDGWAEFGMTLLLENGENAWPKQRFRFICFLQGASEKWLIRVAKDSSIITLSLKPTKEELTLIGEEFDRLLRFQTIESLDRWLGIKND